jgi:hypothetical protein
VGILISGIVVLIVVLDRSQDQAECGSINGLLWHELCGGPHASQVV